MTHPVNKVPGIPRPFGVGQRPFDIDLVRSLHTELGGHARAINSLIPVEGIWTPSLTFTTPGDQSLGAYSRRGGIFTKNGNLVYYSFIVQVVITHTTASGHLAVSGFPFTGLSTEGVFYVGTASVQGVNAPESQPNMEQLQTFMRGSENLFKLSFSGLGEGVNEVIAVNVPSGGDVFWMSSGHVKIVE